MTTPAGQASASAPAHVSRADSATARAAQPSTQAPGRPPAQAATWRTWVAGARPRTLPAALAPVIVGTAITLRARSGVLHAPLWWRAAGCALVALAIQVGTNYANDVADGVRGADTHRVGPVRLVASGLARPRSVRVAAIGAFAVAGGAGIGLAAVTTWWLVAVGAAAMAAGWFYTGGPRPYGYMGLGELFVFAFFGLVATGGTAYVQSGRITGVAVVSGVSIGLLATAILVANNLRDRETDEAAGKCTLAVLLGDRATRAVYVATIAGGIALSALMGSMLHRWWTLVGVGAFALAIRPVRSVLTGATGRDLVAVLQVSALVELVYSVLVSAGAVLS